MTKTELTYKKLIRELGGYHYETALTETIEKLAGTEPYRVYPEGSVVLRKEGSGPKVMLLAHTDVPGVFVTGYHDAGALRFCVTDRLNTAALAGTPVRFENGIMGVIEKTDPAAGAAESEKKLLIDIGASDRAEAEKNVPVGAFGLFAEETEPSADGKALFTPYADDLTGTAILLEVYKRLKDTECPNDLYFVFTADGIMERSGAVAAARDIGPAAVIGADPAYLSDIPGEGHHEHLRLHGGATVVVRAGNYFSPCVYTPVWETAKKTGIPAMLLLDKYGDPEMCSAIEVEHGAVGCGVTVAVGGFGTHRQMFAGDDAENAAKLICAVLSEGLDPYYRVIK